MRAYTEQEAALPPGHASSLRKQIVASKYFTIHTLNRDFVGTRGFSVVFRRDSLGRVRREFPYFEPFLSLALRPDCNAFYLNPLQLVAGSRVDPHIDRSLRSYSVHIGTPVTEVRRHDLQEAADDALAQDGVLRRERVRDRHR